MNDEDRWAHADSWDDLRYWYEAADISSHTSAGILALCITQSGLPGGALTGQRSPSHRDVEELPAGRLPPCMSSSSTAGGIRVVFSELVWRSARR
jgi:hypothetical protein